MSATLYINQTFDALPTVDSTANTNFAEVIGNKSDASSATAGQASVVALCRNILANLSSDTDVAALIGALNTAAATGAVGTGTTVMGYIKQLVTDERALSAIVGTIINAGGTATLGAALGDFANVDLVTRLNTIDDFLDTEVAAIKAVTDLLPNAGALTSIAQASTLLVPTADVATNVNVAQVIGNKSDTVSGTSIVALTKQVLANQAFPTQDLATDATIAQVVGKKSDTVAGTSLVSIGKQVKSYLDGTVAIPVAAKREAGRTQIKVVNITSAANAGLVVLGTVTAQSCLIRSISLRSNGATTADLTTAAIKGGASQVVEFISSATAIKANIDAADKQVNFNAVKVLPATKTIVVDLQGTGATAVDLVATIEYEAVVDGGYIA